MTDSTGDPPRMEEPREETPAGWEDILAPGERILWQGRPAGGIVWSDLVSVQTVFGLFFTGFAVFWTSMASGMGVPRNAPGIFNLFPLFGLLFVGIGLYQVVGRLFWDAFARNRTHYTLTDRAAYIATDLPGKRSLETHRLSGDVPPRLEDGDFGTVWFGEKTHHRPGGWRGGKYRRARTWSTPVGFRRIPDARRVFGLVRQASADGDDPRRGAR
ncbi:hypothetical protein [Wenxinia marina]|uniref:Uncharacterized protein n=1 Tax=Wenxinia marina DSM 24838 TaxID=1123501 RepID=A0A0D0QDE8_9RHOB|nr:hypothetical protein [Wenxinia marina]KIQ70352.1 hypothetical protein Wenmar_00728 [Wenxinia marina DSM 24838]